MKDEGLNTVHSNCKMRGYQMNAGGFSTVFHLNIPQSVDSGA